LELKSNASLKLSNAVAYYKLASDGDIANHRQNDFVIKITLEEINLHIFTKFC